MIGSSRYNRSHHTYDWSPALMQEDNTRQLPRDSPRKHKIWNDVRNAPKMERSGNGRATCPSRPGLRSNRYITVTQLLFNI